MKRVFAFVLLVLGLAGCGAGGGGSAECLPVDTGSSAEEIPDGCLELSEESLTATAEELPQYRLRTNSQQITVKSEDKNADCTVYLCADGADIMEFDLKGRKKKAFTTLTHAREYSLRAENADGITFTVTD